jgi:hypothetical protein
MDQASTIRLPNDWAPRPYQQPVWQYLQDGGRRAVCCWHRRAGKDSLGINWCARAAFERTGTYFHLLPELKHGRKVVWDAIDRKGRRVVDQAFPPEIRESTHDQEMRIRLANGSVWQVVGSDSYDTLVGTNPVGVVFSEYALSNPAAWDFLRPILAENQGFALFISTPRGENHFRDLFEVAKAQEGWFAELLTVDDTKAISRQAVEDERAAGMPDAMIRQEFYCSFQAGVAGAYYGDYLEEATTEGRITRVMHEPDLEVFTAWDLGIDDATVIWFFQLIRNEIHVIDYYENSGVGLEHYAKELGAKPYVYGGHHLPHDVNVTELGTGRSRLQVLNGLGIRGHVVPRVSIEDGIQAVRSILPRCWIDEERCARGIKALRNYRTEYDERAGTFRGRPYHDWTSHAADAFRYLAVGLRHTENAETRRRRGPRHIQVERDYNPHTW